MGTMFRNAVKAVVLCVGFMVFEVFAGAATIDIVHQGHTDFEIVVDANAVLAVREGASELQSYIEKATGIKLPVVAIPTQGKHQIVIGSNALATKAGVMADGFKHDAFQIKAVDGNLFLVGKDEPGNVYYLNTPKSISAGSYYAVVEFLQRFLNVRWYMPGPMGEEVPRIDSLTIPGDFELHSAPRFPMRYIDVACTADKGSIDGFVSAGTIKKSHYDAQTSDLNGRWGRHLRLGKAYKLEVSHAWFMFVPADKPNQWCDKAYGKDHPEYFAMRDGKRQNFYKSNEHHGGQLCVSNPEVARVYAENVIAFSKREGLKSISLSCNDGGEHCQCANCLAWDVGVASPEDILSRGWNVTRKTLPTEGAVLSDRMMRFSNAVAELVVKEIPDIRFGMYAYHENRMPPFKIAGHPNITISDVYNYAPQIIYDDSYRLAMENDIRGWRQKAQGVVLTSYYLGEGNWGMPWSTTDTLGWMVRQMAEQPASDGLILSFGHIDVAPMGQLGPDPWVLGQLLWDPNQSAEKLTKEFYSGAFGKAAPFVTAYFDTINRAMNAELQRAHYRYGTNPARLVVPVYSSIRSECRGLVEKAVAAVADQDQRYRWRVDRIAREWQYAEYTLDAINAARIAKKTEDPNSKDALWGKAIAAGQRRMALVDDPNSRFAIAPGIVEYMDWYQPLGIVTELPNAAKDKRNRKAD